MILKKSNGKSSNEMSRDLIAFIPVRGGSKSIPLKNIKNFCGKPLVYWTLKAAVEAEFINKVVVATDSDEIQRVVESFKFEKVEIYDRSEESATDFASTEVSMLEYAESHIFQSIFLIQATSPLLTSKDLDQAYEKFLNDRTDSLLSVVVQKRFIWKKNAYSNSFSPLNYDPLNRPRRQDWEGLLVENGSFYLTSRQALLESRCRVSGEISIYEMGEDSYFEIDEPSDWIILEKLMQKQVFKRTKEISRINLLICDVDGVLTDAGMYYTESGDELKKFNTRDGKGIEILKSHGVKVMILTSEDRELVRKRAEKLKVDFLAMGIKDKKSYLDQFFQSNDVFSFATTAYIGDDVNDLQSLVEVCFSAAPSDAVNDVISSVDYVCSTKGGYGCVREVCDMLVQARTPNE